MVSFVSSSWGSLSTTSLSNKAALRQQKACTRVPTIAHALSPSSSSFNGHRLSFVSRRSKAWIQNPIRQTPQALLGGGGFLGVGPGEIAVIAAVGWFLLGPEKLYSVSKDIGKLVGDIRRTADEARDTFSDALQQELDASLDTSKSKKSNSTTIAKSPDDDDVPTASNNPENNEQDAYDNGLSLAPQKQTTTVGPTSDEDVQEDTIENSIFLDQLKRVSDPHQAPLVNVPDLSLDDNDDLDEEADELELQRLKIKYFEARARLKAKREKLENATNESNGTLRSQEMRPEEKRTPVDLPESDL